MNIYKEINNIKTLISQGAQLFLLRLRILRLDLEEQIAGLITIFAFIIIAAILLLVSLIALLLSLMILLPDTIKLWVLFGVAIINLLIVVTLIIRIPIIWKRNTQQISQTMQDMQNDLDTISGTVQHIHSEERDIHEQ